MFIKIKERIVNITRVREFQLLNDVIYIHYVDDKTSHVSFPTKAEAAAAHEDILHMIDGNYIPSWVQNTPASYNPHAYDTSNGTSNWHGDIPF